MNVKILAVLLVGILVGGSIGYAGSYLLYNPRLEHLKTEMSDQETRYEDLSNQQKELQKEHESLLTQFQTLSEQHDTLLFRLDNLSVRYEELSREKEELIKKIDELTLESSRNVKINEVLYNPLGADGGNEWVELFNSGESAVNMSGWTISGGDGSVKARIPSLIFPPGCFLIAHFGPEEPGMYDTDFEDDGKAYYFVGTLDEVFHNNGDSVALYIGEPSSETIVDYVAWSSAGAHYSPVAEGFASTAGIWTENEFLNTSYGSGNFVIRGETIGRNSHSVDTDRPEDWDDNGGLDAWGPTEGRHNSGPLYTYDVALFLSQFDVNTMLWEYGLSVDSVTAKNIQVTESENSLLVTMDYEFMVETPSLTIPFIGMCTHRWWAVNETSYSVSITVSLTSDRGESFTLESERHDSGVETDYYRCKRKLEATLISADGLATPYSYKGTRLTKQVADDTFLINDKRVITGIDGANRVANTTIKEITTSDTTSRFTLDATISSELESPETVHIETYIEMDGDRQFNITIPVYTRHSKGYEFNVLEPVNIEFKRVAGQPRDSFGKYRYTYKGTMGNPLLGYGNITIDLYEDYTKVDGKPIIRGTSLASIDGYHIITLKFYVYDWWRKALRTGLRIVSGTAWAVGCFAGTVVGAPTCVGKFVAVGACAAGGVATDSLISDLVTEKK